MTDRATLLTGRVLVANPSPPLRTTLLSARVLAREELTTPSRATLLGLRVLGRAQGRRTLTTFDTQYKEA